MIAIIEGRVQYERLENHDGLRTNEKRGINLSVGYYDFFISGGPEWYYRVDEDDESINYTDKTISFFAGWFPPGRASLRSRTVIGKQEDKDTFFFGPGLSVTLTEKLKFDLGMERLDKENERLMLNRRFGCTYRFSHKMFFRTTFEMTRDDERSIFALYGWEFRPESNFYLVYTDNKEGDEVNRIMFVKISYLLKWNIF